MEMTCSVDITSTAVPVNGDADQTVTLLSGYGREHHAVSEISVRAIIGLHPQ